LNKCIIAPIHAMCLPSQSSSFYFDNTCQEVQITIKLASDVTTL